MGGGLQSFLPLVLQAPPPVSPASSYLARAGQPERSRGGRAAPEGPGFFGSQVCQTLPGLCLKKQKSIFNCGFLLAWDAMPWQPGHLFLPEGLSMGNVAHWTGVEQPFLGFPAKRWL